MPSNQGWLRAPPFKSKSSGRALLEKLSSLKVKVQSPEHDFSKFEVDLKVLEAQNFC